MSLSFFQVDAFTSKVFGGNPAAVFPLKDEKPAWWMQAVAAEMNLSESGFITPEGNDFRLRWFTPTVEVDLCGHCTLASAHVLWETGTLSPERAARFHTRSGSLTVRHLGEWMEMDLPAWEPREVAVPEMARLVTRAEVLAAAENPEQQNLLLEVPTEKDVRDARPDFNALRSDGNPAVILTARSDKYDFVSRYFAAPFGIDEDPVTGSAHCVLAPYWARKLGKNTLNAYQASARGGELKVHFDGGARVRVLGQAVTVFRGELNAAAMEVGL